jgi:tRNA/rRNA methyltransferase
MEVTFVLVNPALPENIGASARAIHTMGFRQLILIDPVRYPHEKAFHVAHGARHILEQAQIYNTLEEALSGFDFAVATSAKRRSVRDDYLHAEKIPGLLKQKKDAIDQVAIVFGGEESGLSNPQLDLCDVVSFLPMQNKYPSLNLSHAVMLYAYILSVFSTPRQHLSKKPGAGKYREMTRKANSVLESLRIDEGSNIHSRIFERLALLSDGDINLVLSFLDKLQKRG